MDKLVEKGFEIYFAPPTTINIYWTPKHYNKSKVYNITPSLTNIPNSNQVVDYYNSIQPQNQLMIKYTGRDNEQMNENDYNYNDTQNYKTIKTKFFNIQKITIHHNNNVIKNIGSDTTIKQNIINLILFGW